MTGRVKEGSMTVPSTRGQPFIRCTDSCPNPCGRDRRGPIHREPLWQFRRIRPRTTTLPKSRTSA
jgi:hypothetical protein